MHGGRVDLVAQFADFLFQRGNPFVLQRQRLLGVLNLAAQFVELLLRGGVLRAGERGGENQNQKPKRNLFHATKINLCPPASRGSASSARWIRRRGLRSMH